MCQAGFCNVLGISVTRLHKHVKAAADGTAPVDGRMLRAHDKGPGWHDADTWFQWVHHIINESKSKGRSKSKGESKGKRKSTSK